MQSFLKQVAEAYTANELENLQDYCFVFPNRRSGMFFRQFLAKATGTATVIMPRIATLAELAAEASPLIEATRPEMLFTMFGEYQKMAGEDIDFDSFLFWGGILLDDFNDVDSNLIDAEHLFVNIERWKEIKSFYLTPEQIEVIKRYWGDDVSPQYVDEFWEHTLKDSDPQTSERFIKLWEVLTPLYKAYTTTLRRLGLASAGMLLRDAAESIESDSNATFGLKRYIFVGFDIPSTGQLAIFKKLQELGKADFYWDFNSPVNADKDNRMARLMARLSHDFSSIYPLAEPRITTFPNLKISGVPSSIGQAKIAGKVLEEWVNTGAIRNCDNAIDTAIVLPDEALFVPAIESVPPVLTAMNVTMGYPMKLTPVAGLMSHIVSLHLRSRKGREGTEYYYEDVEAIITHPIVQQVLEEAAELKKHIRANRLYSVSCKMIAAEFESLKLLFNDTSENTAQAMYDYLTGILNSFEAILASNPNSRMDFLFIEAYHDAIDELFKSICRFNIDMNRNTFMHLVERMLYAGTVKFEGEPLQGLQVMGVLETRALDFDNIVITSMNERIFPRKSQKRSFVPDAIRQAYGLPTAETHSMLYAYYFYRLISRATNVTILYDNRTGGTKSGEVSRYINHLLYLYPAAGALHRTLIFKGQANGPEIMEITKSDAIYKRLLRYAKGGTKKLSPSALKTYLDCPMRFCLQYVMDLLIDDEITDYMEASTFGTIVHAVAENLYRHQAGNGAIVDDRLIGHWIDHPGEIEKQITILINEKYNNSKIDNDLTPLTGEPKVLGMAIKEIILAMLTNERNQFVPITFVEAEKELLAEWHVNNDLTVNFKQIIDRLDRVDGHLRIVDYKTGDEETALGTFDEMFGVGKPNKRKSVFQVLMYCELYRLSTGDDSPVQPYIYNLRKVLTNEFKPVTYNKATLLDYHEISEEFVGHVNQLLSDIFDREKPFTQAESSENCRFCKFTEICQRNIT